jgi:hypothetical protein
MAAKKVTRKVVKKAQFRTVISPLSKGGTEMWCPQCEEIAICAAIPNAELGLISGQRICETNQPDLNWFRRARQCQECFHEFVTAEIEEKFIDKLCEMRKALADIQIQLDGFHKAARMARAAVKKVDDILEKS